MRKKNICIDFDGVLNNYTGWNGENNLGDMKKGCDMFLKKISKDYHIIIFTTRDEYLVKSWLEKYDLSDYVFQITNKKVPAYLYVDDRALCFRGDFERLMNEIDCFMPYWKY